jgi:hypothetical protein
MFLVSLLAGVKAVSHAATTVRVDPTLIAAFGLPGCAEQSVIAKTLNTATEQDVADLQAALDEIFACYDQARRHYFNQELLVLDVDLSPRPSSQQAEESEQGYMGRCRSKTGRKLARTEIRLDSGWGGEAMITWHASSSPGREVVPVPKPETFVSPLQQYAVRTPSKEHKGGYYYAVVWSFRTDLSMTGVDEHYDGRASMEADLKGGKHGLALTVICKQHLPAQKIVVLLIRLAHNVLLWARQWLAKNVPRLCQYSIVRLVREDWAIPGRIKLTDKGVQRVRLRHTLTWPATCSAAFVHCWPTAISRSL